ncbi:UNVERIFIED_CONTAM: hypothetical protein FKN15_059815 [Acipenser sinensis]
MDQWIHYNPDPSQTQWDGGLEDLLVAWRSRLVPCLLGVRAQGGKLPLPGGKGGTACPKAKAEEGHAFPEANKRASVISSVREGGAACTCAEEGGAAITGIP